MKQVIRLTESDLHRIIKESVTQVLNETTLGYDIDNFSGRWTKNPGEYIDDEGYLDDPNNPPDDFYDDERWLDDKDSENEYSWNKFEHKPIAPGLDNYYKVGKRAIPREVDDAIQSKNKKGDWSEMELRHRDRMMDKFVKGKRTPEQIGDAWDDVQYFR